MNPKPFSLFYFTHVPKIAECQDNQQFKIICNNQSAFILTASEKSVNNSQEIAAWPHHTHESCLVLDHNMNNLNQYKEKILYASA